MVSTHMWDIKLKATMNKKDKQKLIDRDNSMVTRRKGGRVVKGKECQIYCDRR